MQKNQQLLTHFDRISTCKANLPTSIIAIVRLELGLHCQSMIWRPNSDHHSQWLPVIYFRAGHSIIIRAGTFRHLLKQVLLEIEFWHYFHNCKRGKTFLCTLPNPKNKLKIDDDYDHIDNILTIPPWQMPCKPLCKSKHLKGQLWPRVGNKKWSDSHSVGPRVCHVTFF